MDAAAQASVTSHAKTSTWVLVFIFCFLGLLIDGADLMLLSYSLSSLKAEFGLSNVEAGSLGSFTLAGMAIGGIYGGWACDRFGRVKTVVWSITLFSVGTAVLGLTHSYWQFAITRFVASLGIGALYVACNTLMSEYVPTRYRTTVLGTLQAGWSVGYIVATLLAGWILPSHGWRWLFYIAIIPVILAVVMQHFVPEPQAWINAQTERARNKLTGTQSLLSKKRESMYKLIFRDPQASRMFIFWALTAGFLQFGHHQHFLDAAARHADLFALQVLDRFDVRVGPGHQARAALGEAGHHINRGAAGAAGDGRFRGGGADVEFTGNDRLHHVEALGEDFFLHLDAAFRRDFLDIRDGAVVGELEVAEPDHVLGVGRLREQGCYQQGDGLADYVCSHCLNLRYGF